MDHVGTFGRAFATYIREALVPGIQPGTVVIPDNLATHRIKEAEQTLREHGCRLPCLPPCSPDLNPIEQAFSKLKSHLRWIGARTFADMFEATGQICDLRDPTEWSNGFGAAGYWSCAHFTGHSGGCGLSCDELAGRAHFQP